MKIVKIFLFMLLTGVIFPITCLGQTKVAILDPITGEDSNVSSFEKALLRGELRKAIFHIDGFEAIARSDIDQVLNELDFQHMGYVPKQEIHRLGQISGADYLCICSLNKSETQFYLEAYLVDVSTGKIESPASQLGIVRDGDMVNLYSVCNELVYELIGDKMVTGGKAKEETFEQNTWGWTLFLQDNKSVQIIDDELRIANNTGVGTTQTDVLLPIDVNKNFQMTINMVIQDAKVLSSAGIRFGGYNNELTINSGTCAYHIGDVQRTSAAAKIGVGKNKPVVIHLVKQGERVAIQVNGLEVCEEECTLTSNQMSIFVGINTVALVKNVSIQYIK